MGHPPVEDAMPLHLRMPGALVRALDEWIEEVKATLPPGGTITRTTLVRDLLQRAVDAHVAEKKRSVTPSKT